MRLRYEAQASRDRSRALAELVKLRKSDEAHAALGAEEPAAEEAPGASEVVSEPEVNPGYSARWAAEAAAPNEPKGGRPVASPMRPEDVRIVPEGPVSGGSRGPGGFKDPA